MSATPNPCRALRSPPLWAAVMVGQLLSCPAFAHDVSDELTLGRIATAADGSSTGYWSDRVRGSAQLSEAWAVDLGASVTRYAASQGVTRADIFQLALGTSYTPDDHFAFDFDTAWSPPSLDTDHGVQITQARKGAVRDRSSLLGFDLGAEYDTASDGNADSVIGLALGATDYETTQRVRLRKAKLTSPPALFGAPENSSLWQVRAELSFIETLYEDTDLGMAGSYYFYSRDTANSGYYGETVFGRVELGDGIPVVPLQYALRPSVTQRIRALQLRAHFQFGEYRYGEGTSLIGGLKVQYKFGRSLRVWLAANLQHDTVTGSSLNNLWCSAGVRWVFG